MGKTNQINEKEKKTGQKPSMLDKYFETKEKYPDYLVFYRLGDFYELFFDDAKLVSKVLNLVLTNKSNKKDAKAREESSIPMCGVPFHAYESYLEKLVKLGYKVAICDQMETPEQAKERGGSGAIIEREVTRLVTAGTLTEDTLLDGKKNNYLACMMVDKVQASVSYVDISTGDFKTQTVPLSKLHSALVKLDPAELLMEDKAKKIPDLYEVLYEFEKKITFLPSSRFSYINAKKRLEEFWKVASLEAFGSFNEEELTTAGVLMDYINLTQKGSYPYLKHLQKVIATFYMEIDAATRRNLELFASLSGGRRGKSLLNVIDRTVTNAGGRLLSSYLSAPLTDAKRIKDRLDAVDFFVSERDVLSKLREVLSSFPDIERAISRLSVKRGGPRDLAALRDALGLVPKLRNILDHELLPVRLKNQREQLYTLDEVSLNLQRTLKAAAADMPVLARDGGFVAEGYSAELDMLQNKKGEHEAFINELQAKYAEMTRISALKIASNSQLGYFVEVPSRFYEALKNFPGIEFRHLRSMINSTRFTTEDLDEFNSQLQDTEQKALDLELAIYDELVILVMKHVEELLQISQAVAGIDVAAALAVTALENNYCRPVIDDSLFFDIQGGRHPVVEASLKEMKEGPFVENDCCMDEEKGRLWLLTGPNMAGKSTFLRQNALIAILAQMGSFVPASSAHIGVIDKLFSRVGASDDLARGRSTFMVEMIETSLILNQATERSFVILDEIGRGTATFDGLSIAWAVAEYLHNVNKCRALFATHYHELTDLSATLPHLSLHAMRTKQWHGDVVFLHEVADGAVDRSYGIHVGKLAGLPGLVIRRAEQVLARLESQSGKSRKSEAFIEELPLFDKMVEKLYAAEPSEAEKELLRINPDEFSPKEALEELYRLREMAQKRRSSGNDAGS